MHRLRHFLKEWREFFGLTQEELADAMHTSKATVSRIESGKIGYTQGNLEAAARALNTTPAMLLHRPPRKSDRIVPSQLDELDTPRGSKGRRRGIR